MAINGADILIYIGANKVGSQTGVNISKNRNIADASAKDSADFVGMPARKTSTIQLNALYVPSDTAWAAIKAAYDDGTAVTVNKYESGSAVETASAFISNMTEDAPDQTPATIAITLEVSGGWSAV